MMDIRIKNIKFKLHSIEPKKYHQQVFRKTEKGKWTGGVHQADPPQQTVVHKNVPILNPSLREGLKKTLGWIFPS